MVCCDCGVGIDVTGIDIGLGKFVVFERNNDYIQSDLETKAPTLSVLCGMSSVKFAFEKDLLSYGFDINSNSRIKFLLDAPRSYALRTLESMDRSGNSRVVVVTWNTCPEHLEDIRDLHPNALFSDDFLLRQDLPIALHEILVSVSDGVCYDFARGPGTVLTSAERAVLRYVAQGWDNKRIGYQLYIEEQTVKNRLRSVYRKLNLRNHAEAVLYYWHLWQATT